MLAPPEETPAYGWSFGVLEGLTDEPSTAQHRDVNSKPRRGLVRGGGCMGTG